MVRYLRRIKEVGGQQVQINRYDFQSLPPSLSRHPFTPSSPLTRSPPGGAPVVNPNPVLRPTFSTPYSVVRSPLRRRPPSLQSHLL